MTVTVYTARNFCPACNLTKKQLDRLGVRFTEVPIDTDDGILAAAEELGLRQAPIVCASSKASGEQYWDGYRPDRITALAQEISA